MGILFSATCDNGHSQAVNDETNDVKIIESQQERIEFFNIMRKRAANDRRERDRRYNTSKTQKRWMSLIPKEHPLLALSRAIEAEVGNNKDVDTSELFSRPLIKKKWENCVTKQTPTVVRQPLVRFASLM